MDNHPIPQDITGFQFKLVGNMTVRQFVYLAVGAIFAWLFFFILNLPALIKWPLSIFCISTGAIFAFVPVDGRPMDTMLRNFLRAILSPTQFIYQKEGIKIENQTMPKSQPLNLPQAHILNAQPIIPIQAPPAPIIQEIQTPITPVQAVPIQYATPQPSPGPMPASIPTPSFNTPSGINSMSIDEVIEPEEIKKKNRELEKTREEKEKLEEELKTLKKQLDEAMKAKEEIEKTPIPDATPIPAPIPVTAQPSESQEELEKQLIESNRQREALEKQLLTERAKQQTPDKTFSPSVAKLAQTQRVRSVPPGMEKSAGIPSMPEAPNLITGIVKDPRGNPLQNILIEVKDQDSNPVRAFKTNGLGKFASATSLSNGKYLITFEDSKEVNKFDAVEIELSGTPVMPLEIISVDPREELRRELFK